MLSLPIELAKKYWGYRSELNHCYTIAEISLLSLYYYRLAQNKIVTLVIIAAWMLIFAGIISQDGYFNSKSWQDRTVAHVAVCLFVVQYFIDLIRRPISHPLNRDGDFWINVGNILFFSGALIHVTIMSIDIHIQPEVFQKIQLINHLLNLFLYIAYATGFVLENKKTAKPIRFTFGKSAVQ